MLSARRLLTLLFMVLGLCVNSAYAQAESRLALLIGNAAYKASPLANPINDVRLMEEALQQAGFTVIKAENASIREMRRLVRDFGDRLKASGGVGLFYFAGHGVQVRGENYLVSTDSDIRNEDEVADDSINANLVLEKMQSAGNRMNMVILDACRNNPFAVKSRGAVNGLATLNAPSGSLVAYATAPGSVASDGTGSNGLYTHHLASVIRQPGLAVEEVFKQVRAAVRRDSNNQQTPWENTALEGQFYFHAPGQGTASSAAPSSTANQADRSALDLAFWDSVKSTQHLAELQAYLSQFPNGNFAPLARVRINELRVSATAPVSVPVKNATEPPGQPTAAAGVVGTMTLTERLTGITTSIEVAVEESDDEKTTYSTGDVIAKDGTVLKARVGDMVLRLISGELWKVPVKPGTSGEARLNNPAERDLQVSLKWSTSAAGDGKTQLDAMVYVVAPGTVSVAGPLRATYDNAFPLPIHSFTDIRGRGPATNNTTSAELKLRRSGR